MERAEQNLPLVTVVVPSYNHEKFITKCIESIVNQTYTNINLIIIDDGSTDSSQLILKELQKKYKFDLFFQENKGLPFIFNKVIKESNKGKYFTFCASDDYWDREKIENQVGFMEKNPHYPMSFGKTFYIDEIDNIIPKEDINNNKLKGGYIFNELFLFKFHPPVNYIFRSNIFDLVGLYDNDLIAEDFDMNLRISSKFQIGYLEKNLSYYRISNSNGKLKNREKLTNSHLKSIDRFKENILYRKSKHLIFLRNFLEYSKHTKYKILGMKYMIKSINLFYHKYFILGIFNLIFSWK